MDNKNNIVNNWLGKLQQESWNLELLISGFSIFLLIQAGDILLTQMSSLRAHYLNNSPFILTLVFLMGIAYLASKVLTLNLIVHVILRGFWIGAIGLRSVQEKIDFERLGYTPFFTEQLRNKVGTLDQLLIRLDTLCSVIFAFTFLIVFMFISLFLYFLLLIVVFQFLISISETLESEFVQLALLVLLMVFIFTGALYMFDTLSLGLLKKIKWIKRFYYPIYRFYSFITASAIYRSIYYSLVSRFPKRWIIGIMVPYVVIFSLTPFHKVDYYQFFPDNVSSANLINNHYDNQRAADNYIQTVSIPSMIHRTDLLPLFIRYNIDANESLRESCTDYTPSKSTGLISGIRIGRNGFGLNDPSVAEDDPRALLKCLSELYSIYINDSLYTEVDFYYRTHPHKGEFGIQTMISTKDLPRGKNDFQIFRKKIENGEAQEIIYANFLFWLE